MRARFGRRVLETFGGFAAARVTLIGPVRVFDPRAVGGFASGLELFLVVLLRFERFLYARLRERAFGSEGVEPSNVPGLRRGQFAVVATAQFVPDDLSFEARTRRLFYRVFLRFIAGLGGVGWIEGTGRFGLDPLEFHCRRCLSKQRCRRHDCEEHDYCRGSHFHFDIFL